MKYGSDMPTLVAAIISRNPKPYPKVIPAIHILGADGNNSAGNNAIETKSKNPSTGLLKAPVSQSKTGTTTCKNENIPLVKIRNKLEVNK